MQKLKRSFINMKISLRSLLKIAFYTFLSLSILFIDNDASAAGELEFKIQSWYEFKNSSPQIKSNNTVREFDRSNKSFVILHNNGEPIQTNILRGSAMYLEAITVLNTDGFEVTEYYFNEVGTKKSVENLKRKMITDKDQNKLIIDDINKRHLDPSTQPIQRNF